MPANSRWDLIRCLKVKTILIMGHIFETIHFIYDLHTLQCLDILSNRTVTATVGSTIDYKIGSKMF